MPILDFLRRLTRQPATEVIDLTPMLKSRAEAIEEAQDAPPAAVMQARQRWAGSAGTPAESPIQGDQAQ